MNYDKIRQHATAGVNFFSDEQGEYVLIVSGGGVQIINGKEVTTQEVRATVRGLVREIADREINGESILAGDKRGIFTYEQEITKGMRIIVDGEHYAVVNARPVKPTGTLICYRPVLRRIAVGG